MKMEKKSETLLLAGKNIVTHLKVGGPVAWFQKENNPSTGYRWQCVPDNSGVYAEVAEVTLVPNTGMVGTPGLVQWGFKAVKAGKGSIAFDHYAPGSSTPAERVIVDLDVA
jgi:predicted secreted protein